MLAALRTHYPGLAALYVLARSAPNAFIKRKNSSVTEDAYRSSKLPLSQEPIDITDTAAAFFLRVVLSGHYRTVVELGATDGRRISLIKSLAPNIDAIGLDILESYKFDRDIGGVRFRYYSEDFFTPDLPRPILLCRGTLSCLAPDEAKALVNRLAQNGWSIALVEPAPPFHIDQSITRFTGTYYHPYKELFANAGMNGAVHLPRDGFNLSLMEYWARAYAVPQAN